MNLRLKGYRKEFAHSYAYGVFATLELLAGRPQHALGVILSSKCEKNSGIAQLRSQCARHRVPMETNDRTVERLCRKESHLAIGVFRKYHSRIDPGRNHVVLVNPSDMGNLGTILRTMVGFGFSELAIIRPAADIFDPRTVRSSLGAVFRVSFEYFDCFSAWRSSCGHHVYSFMTNGRAALDRVRFEPPFALVFGNEGRGLGDEFLEAGTSVAIPHRGPIDSLNLSVAAGIALYVGAKGGIGSCGV